MKKIIAILLLISGLGLGYYGFDKMNNSGGSLEIGKLEISAEDSGAKNQSYVLLGGGALLLILGVGLMARPETS